MNPNHFNAVTSNRTQVLKILSPTVQNWSFDAVYIKSKEKEVSLKKEIFIWFDTVLFQLKKVRKSLLKQPFIEELSAPHFEGSKWVRHTPHFFALRNQLGAVRLKIAKIRGTMSKVRRTQFFNEWKQLIQPATFLN